MTYMMAQNEDFKVQTKSGGMVYVPDLSGNAADVMALDSQVKPLQFANWYPDGSVTDEGQFTELQYNWDQRDENAREVSVCTFMADGGHLPGDNNNADKTGHVVIPPYVDHEGVRYKVTGIARTSTNPLDFEGSPLTAVTIPTTVTNIGQYAFGNCSNLTLAVIPGSVTTIGRSAFQYCAKLPFVAIPNSVVNIGDGAFYECEKLSTLVVPGSVKNIGTGVFSKCTALKTVTFLQGVTEIPYECFGGCSAIETVTFPNSVTGILNSAFNDVSNLVVLNFGSTPFGSVPSLALDVFPQTTSCTIVVPDENYDAWTTADNWSELPGIGYTFLRYSAWEAPHRYEVLEKYTKPADGIPTGDIALGAVTSALVARDAVTTDKIADGAVTFEKLAEYTDWTFSDSVNHYELEREYRSGIGDGWVLYVNGEPSGIFAPDEDGDATRLTFDGVSGVGAVVATRVKLVPTKTFQLENNGEDGIHPFTTMENVTNALSVSIVKSTNDSSYAAVYTVYQGGTPLEQTINIPKDFLVKSAALCTCVEPDVPVSGYEVGDKYIDFVVSSEDSPQTVSHVYLNVKDLVDVYTAQPNATQVQLHIDDNNVISGAIVSGSIGTRELSSGIIPTASNTEPRMDGDATSGNVKTYARGDHVHPHDTSKRDYDDLSYPVRGYPAPLSGWFIVQKPDGTTETWIPFDQDGIQGWSASGGYVGSDQYITIVTGDVYRATLGSGSSGIRDLDPKNAAAVHVIEYNGTWIFRGYTGLEPDSLVLMSDVAKYATKVENAVEGNFASLNSNGDLTDSGKNAQSFVKLSGDTMTGNLTIANSNSPELTISQSTGPMIIGGIETNYGLGYIRYGSGSTAAGQLQFDFPLSSGRLALREELSTVTSVPMTPVEWQELKTLRDNGNLVPGMQYRITDYVATTNGDMNSRSANHPFDVIVTADSISILNENARAIQHEGDEHFTNSNLAAWSLKYCLDNDANRFTWAICEGIRISLEHTLYHRDSDNDVPNASYPYCWTSNYTLHVYTNTPTPTTSTSARGQSSGGGTFSIEEVTHDDGSGRGIIYGMVDEFENDLPYDFKGIQFRRWAITDITSSRLSPDDIEQLQFSFTYANTSKCFSYTSANFSVNGVNFIVDANTSEWCYTFHTWGTDGSLHATNGFYHNHMLLSSGRLPSNVFFDGSCYHNVFGFDCEFNTFDVNCTSNILGDFSNHFLFGYGCYSNVFGSNCSYIILAPDSFGNTFGSDCQQNVFGTSCSYITFGHGCTNNILRSYFLNITFEDTVSYVDLICTGEPNSNAFYKNVTVCRGIRGTSAEPKSISDPNVNQSYKTVYQPANSRVVSV